jgi:HK97 family phage major capsid protein
MLVGDNFSDAISRLSQGYLNGAKWIVGKTVKHYLRTLKDTNRAYVFQQPQAGKSATLWEYPILESEHCPATAASTVAAVFGNLKNFIIGRRNGAMVIEIDPYGLFTTNQTRFRMVTRWALKAGNAAGFVSIVTAA